MWLVPVGKHLRRTSSKKGQILSPVSLVSKIIIYFFSLQPVNGIGVFGLPCFTHWLFMQIQVSSSPPNKNLTTKSPDKPIIITNNRNIKTFFMFPLYFIAPHSRGHSGLLYIFFCGIK